MRVTPIHAAPAEMIGKPRSLGSLHKRFQAAQMLAVGALRRAEVHGNAVLNDFVLFQDFVENAQRAPAVDHEIFGYNFEPIHNGLAGQNMLVMGDSQPDADSVVCVSVKPICWHIKDSMEAPGA